MACSEYWIGPLGIKIPLTIKTFPNVDGYNYWNINLDNPDMPIITCTDLIVKNPKYTKETFLEKFAKDLIYNGTPLPSIPKSNTNEFFNDMTNIYGPLWEGPANVWFPWTKITSIPGFDGNVGALYFNGYKYNLCFTDINYGSGKLTELAYIEIYSSVIGNKNVWK
jgi:hypothetical protein